MDSVEMITTNTIEYPTVAQDPEPVAETPAATTTSGRTKRKSTKEEGTVTNRPAAECYTTDPKKMTDKERTDVILFFQEQLESIYNQYEVYKKNTEGAFEQVRILRNENERLRNESRAKINLLRQNINMMYQNSLLIEMEG